MFLFYNKSTFILPELTNKLGLIQLVMKIYFSKTDLSRTIENIERVIRRNS